MPTPLTVNDSGKRITTYQCPGFSIQDITKQLWQGVMADGITMDNIRIRLTTSRTHGGGTRLWFTCPKCERRCGKLYRHPESMQIGCRKCLDLVYLNQRYKDMAETEIWVK